MVGRLNTARHHACLEVPHSKYESMLNLMLEMVMGSLPGVIVCRGSMEPGCMEPELHGHSSAWVCVVIANDVIASDIIRQIDPHRVELCQPHESCALVSRCQGFVLILWAPIGYQLHIMRQAALKCSFDVDCRILWMGVAEDSWFQIAQTLW